MIFATATSAGTDLGNGFEHFAQDIQSPRFIKLAAARSGMAEPGLQTKLQTLLAEARFGLGILKEYDLDHRRILEVGAGAGLLSSYLRSRGLDVVSSEPDAIGFSEHRELSLALSEYLGTPADRHLPIGIEELDPARHGTFDFIFSIHVMEHVGEVSSCLSKMNQLLNEDGMMVHFCPNYVVSYEPHYRIPLVPFFPRFTKFVLPGTIVRQELWRSINFVTLPLAARCARREKSHITFRSGTLYEAFTRLRHDSEFRERQRGLVSFVSKVLNLFGADRLLKLVPPLLSTPMWFEWRKAPPHP